MCEHRYPCILCGEPIADKRDWPCESCLAAELVLEEDFASDAYADGPDPDIEREVKRLDELTAEERADYEARSHKVCQSKEVGDENGGQGALAQ